MADRSETVGVRLTPGERAKFEEFLRQSNEFDSLSRFLRTVAHRYIATSNEEQTLNTEEISDAVESAVSPFEARLDQIEEHVISIDSNVRNDDEIDRLARDIYSSLPQHSHGSELPDFDEVGRFADGSDLAIAQAISTPYIWAEYYSVDIADVRRACGRMMEYYPDVSFITDSTGGPESQVPAHDDVDLNQTDDHTDVYSSQQDSVNTQTVKPSDDDRHSVRRYFKTEGE